MECMNTSPFSNGIFVDRYQPHGPPFFPPQQDPRQSGLQQHCHYRGSQEKRLFTKPGETAFKEQRHPPTELTAAADSSHERIAGPSLPLKLCVGADGSRQAAQHEKAKTMCLNLQFYATSQSETYLTRRRWCPFYTLIPGVFV